jgi:hypothetical protein
MDLVWICRKGPNEELRYSIRSATQNLPHDNVWVIGGKPTWYRGKHIATRQNGTKFQNARANMNALVNCVEIQEDFVLMNDDFFVLQPVQKLDYYYSGLLSTKLRYFETHHPNAKYTRLLRKSYDRLIELGVDKPKDYALHLPFRMQKSKLAQILPLNMSWHLAYGNLYKVGGKKIQAPKGVTKDVKIYLQNNQLSDVSENPLSETFLSTEDRAFRLIKRRIMDLFPVASKYERTT